MAAIRIPERLRGVDREEAYPTRSWLAGLPATITRLARDWSLELGEPYEPGGRCAWVAPVRDRAGDELALKVFEALDEAGEKALARDIIDLVGRCNRTGDQTMVRLLYTFPSPRDS